MAFDVRLAERIRNSLEAESTLAERKMFGGLAFLVHGHMVVAARGGGGLMVRVDPDSSPDLVRTTPAEYVEMRGSSMKGWLRLDSEDVASDEELGTWVDRALTYSETLPPKS